MGFKLLTDKLANFKGNATEYLNRKYSEFTLKSVEEFVSIGGVRIDNKEQEAERKLKCQTCPFRTNAEVLPYIVADNCGMCGCFIDIKAKFERYLNPTTLELSDKHCEWWTAIDLKYKNQKTVA